jgi:hypothetical protein
MELLQCNIVIVKPSEPKILRLNLKRNSRIYEAPGVLAVQHAAATVQDLLRGVESPNELAHVVSISAIARNGYPRLKASTPTSSPEEIMTPFTPSDPGTSSKSSSDTSPCQVSGPLSNNGSCAELASRGAILEVAAAGTFEKGASFRAFYPDIDDGVIVPGLLSPDSSPDSMLQKSKQGNTRAPADFSKPPTGL